VSFASLAIANPDLPERIKNGFPLSPYTATHLLLGDEKGYTDYPVYRKLNSKQ